MKVLVLDCIKDNEGAETKIALDKFIEGIANAGAEIKIINVNDLDIKPCYSCTAQYSFSYSDKCRCDDDMNQLYPEFRNSDSWVFATHVNSNGATKYIKNVLDRMEPLFQPINNVDSDSLIEQNAFSDGKMILLSSYEHESAELARDISEYVDSISLLFSKKIAGNILFDQSRIDEKRLDMIYSFGKNFVND